MNTQISTVLLVLSLLFSFPSQAEDGVTIFITGEDGYTETSYVADCMSNYLALLPQVDGDSIEIRSGESFPVNSEIADELFGLLRDFSKADVFDSNDRIIEFNFAHEGSWYIVELEKNALSTHLKISRPSKVSIPTDGSLTFKGYQVYWTASEEFQVDVMPFGLTKKLFLPYAYGLVVVSETCNFWRLSFKRNLYTHNKFLVVSERTVVNERSGNLLREFTIEALGNAGR